MMSTYTILNLISDAKLALQSEAYFSALSLTFAIISECANMEYPDEWFDKNASTDEYMKEHFPNHYDKNGKYKCLSHDKERFQMWIDDWKNDHNCVEPLKSKMKRYKDNVEKSREFDSAPTPRVTGELLYRLRCTLFHEASSNIDFQKLTDIGNSTILPQEFTLVLDQNPHPTFVSTTSKKDACISDQSNNKSEYQSSLNINISSIIEHCLSYAEKYYKDHKDKNFGTILISKSDIAYNPQNDIYDNSTSTKREAL